MSPIPFEHGMVLAGLLFGLGLLGVLARRNLLFVLLSIEVMLNATALAFVVAGARWGQADGQVMVLLVFAMAAAEAAVGLAIVVQVRDRLRTLDADEVSEMQG